MAGLDGGDLSCDTENRWGLDKRSSTEISRFIVSVAVEKLGSDYLRRNTDVLQDACGGNHSGSISKTKFVLANRYWLGSHSTDGTVQGGNVGSLSSSNRLQVDNICWLKTDSGEFVVREHGEALLIESSLEVF